MDKIKTIYIIHAADAEQHLGQLKKIGDSLKSEQRINTYQTVSSSSVNESTFSQLGSEDMVIMLLTNGIELEKAAIEELLLKVKSGNPNAKISEVLIDNIPYEPSFMAFPTDLRPIRSREDMDVVWGQIGNSIRSIFPSVETPPIPKPSIWKKYIPYILGALVLILLAFFLFEKCSNKVVDDDSDSLEVNKITVKVDPDKMQSSNCPEEVTFYAFIEAKGAGKIVYRWNSSRGKPGKLQTLDLQGNRGGEVKLSEKIGRPGQKVEGWVQLEIMKPVSMASEKVSFYLDCAGGVKVEAYVEGDKEFKGLCPKKFEFGAKITVDEPVTIKYRWIRNDGGKGPEKSLSFANAGSKTVNTSWRLGGSSQLYEKYWEQLEITSPVNLKSNKAIFSLKCDNIMGSFFVNEVFTIAGRGTTLTGKVFDGTIKKGDKIFIGNTGQAVECAEIRVAGQAVDIATNGQTAGFLVRGSDASTISRHVQMVVRDR